MAPTETTVTRVEAFSDAVFAIAITLLSLELKVPHEPGVRLVVGLAHLWPEYLAFALSFVTVGVIWLNHHHLFTWIRRTDNPVLLWNGLLLMLVAVVPFSNALLAEYLGHPGQRVAAMVYSGTFVCVTLVFYLLWHHAVRPASLLLGENLDTEVSRTIGRKYAFALFCYALSFILATASAIASVILDIMLALYLALPAVDLEVIEREQRLHA